MYYCAVVVDLPGLEFVVGVVVVVVDFVDVAVDFVVAAIDLD